jgi:hypothetical protein
MNTQEKLREAQRMTAHLQRTIANCKHDWDEPYKSVRIEKVFTHKMVAHGSDIYPEVSGSYDKEIPIWKRECKSCGKVEETDKTAPVISEYKPVF